MTVGMDAGKLSVQKVTKQSQVVGSVGFDWTMIAVCTWLVLGGYSDAWAHNHVPSLETFFTPWHGVLYTGLLITIIFLFGVYLRNRLRGYSWNHALPSGYGLSLIGVALFALGGVGDLIWHTLFGIELNIDGALSPTHLLLTTSLVLIVSGPYRAAWYRSTIDSKQSLLELLPMLLSLPYILSVMTLISQIAHPFVFIWPSYPQQDPFGNQSLAVVSILLQTIILMGLVLLTIRRWTLPFGSLTLLFTLNIFLLSFMQDHYVLIFVAVLTGLIADALYLWLKPSVTRPADLRLFAFAVPVILYLLYFLVLKLTSGVNWTIHLWLGTTFVAGIAGLLLSFLLVPPEIPEKAMD